MTDTEPRTGTKDPCRHCGEEIVYSPFFNDARGPNPAVWWHTTAGRTCSNKPKGWRSDTWPTAEPEPAQTSPQTGTQGVEGEPEVAEGGLPRQQDAAAERRLRLAHAARRAKEHQLDDIRRALCDIGFMEDDDPYSHADLADVIRQVGQTLPTEQADTALARVQALAEQWQAAMRPGETHPAAQQIHAALDQLAQGETA